MATKRKRTRIVRAWGSLDILDDTQAAKVNIDRSLVAALEASANPLRTTAVREVPKKTHALERSIKTNVDAAELSLALTSGGRDAKHAHLVEYGTVHSRPNPYMRRTIRIERPAVQVRIQAALGRKQT